MGWRRVPVRGRPLPGHPPDQQPAVADPATPADPDGGTGEKRTLRLVARHADACNVFDIPDGGATIRRKLDVLAEHCAAVDRPYAEIEKTSLSTVDLRPGKGSVAEYVERFTAAAELGVDQAIFNMPGISDPAVREKLPELAAAVRDITPAGR